MPGFFNYLKRKAPEVTTAKRANNTIQKTTKLNRTFTPSNVRPNSWLTRKFKNYGVKYYGFGPFAQLHKRSNQALRARTNGNKAANIAAKANEAQEKYNRCDCEGLKKQIDANKAGLITRILHGKGIFSSATLGDIKAEELIEADKKVAQATRAAAQKFKGVQERLVKVGALSRQMADDAIKAYEDKRDTAIQAAKNAEEAHKRNISARKRRANTAKWNGKGLPPKNASVASATRRAAAAAVAAEKAKNVAQNATAEAAHTAAHVEAIRNLETPD
jgi:hypothetical protein